MKTTKYKFPRDPHTPPVTVLDNLVGLSRQATQVAIYGGAWAVERLAECKRIRELWISKVTDQTLAPILEACRPDLLTTLLIRQMRVDDLSPLAKFDRLEVLALDRNTKTRDISFLENLPRLRHLWLEDFTGEPDIAPLATCTHLESLALVAFGYGRRWRASDLQPLSALRALQYLRLTNVTAGDRSLAPLAKLRNLRELDISNIYPTEEYARLSVALPNTHCLLFQAYVDLTPEGLPGQMMVVGKGKPVLDKEDRLLLRNYEREFEEYQEQARSR